MDQERTAEWKAAVSKLAALARQQDNLSLGDYLHALEKTWARKVLQQAVEEAGIIWDHARQTLWVSKKIPPQHSLRQTHLTYSHLRAVANTQDPAKWGNLAVESHWSVARLEEAIEKEALGATLRVEEREQLAQCEAVVDRGLQTFVAVGQALLSIRDGRLYRETYETFEDYCRKRWGMARQHAYRLIDAADVVAAVSPIGDTLPVNEAQVRPLTALKDPQQQREVWAEVVHHAAGKPITAAQVKRAVQEAKRQRPEAPPPITDSRPSSDCFPDPGCRERPPHLDHCIAADLDRIAQELAARYSPEEWDKINERVLQLYALNDPNSLKAA